MTREEVEQRFKENQALVTFAIRKYYHQYLGDDDISQIGSIGLWKAVKTHDPEKGKFSGYAVTCIKHEIDRHFQELNTQKRKGDIISLDGFLQHERNSGNSDVEVLLHETVGSNRMNWFDSEGILKNLDKKNRSILAKLAKGYTQREIADELGCTAQCVGLRVREIRRIVKKYV